MRFSWKICEHWTSDGRGFSPWWCKPDCSQIMWRIWHHQQLARNLGKRASAFELWHHVSQVVVDFLQNAWNASLAESTVFWSTSVAAPLVRKKCVNSQAASRKLTSPPPTVTRVATSRKPVSFVSLDAASSNRDDVFRRKHLSRQCRW